MTDQTGLAAVLFDMDGTLLDSEKLWAAALDALAERLGGVLSEAARLAMLGRNAAESMRIFYQDLGLVGRDPRLDGPFLSAHVTELFGTDLTWRPGAAQLLAEVRAAALPTALVTSTHRPLTEVALGQLGRHNFDVVICGDEVTRPKPHPESYRAAADRLGTPIQRCVAIEDSPTGVASALAAGAVVVGVPSEVALVAADGLHLVDSLAAVDVPFLARLVERAR